MEPQQLGHTKPSTSCPVEIHPPSQGFTHSDLLRSPLEAEARDKPKWGKQRQSTDRILSTGPAWISLLPVTWVLSLPQTTRSSFISSFPPLLFLLRPSQGFTLSQQRHHGDQVCSTRTPEGRQPAKQSSRLASTAPGSHFSCRQEAGNRKQGLCFTGEESNYSKSPSVHQNGSLLLSLSLPSLHDDAQALQIN